MDFEEYDTTKGIVDWPDDYFVTIAKEYLAAGNGRKGTVGAAESYLFDAASLVRFGIRWMEDHFAAAVPGKEGSMLALSTASQSIPEILYSRSPASTRK
jgi:hypothetical protein